MNENEVAREIVDAAYQIHRKLGPGLLESVYETVLAFELGKRGLDVQRQVPVPIVYEGISFIEGYRADLIVENKVIVELKSVETVCPCSQETTVDVPAPRRQTAWIAGQLRLGTDTGRNIPRGEWSKGVTWRLCALA